jgi:thiamine biosynthesis lipoprotein
VTGVSVTTPNVAGPGAVSPAASAIGGPAERLRHAEHVMGTVFSFDIPAAAAPVLPQVVRWLHWVDATFSTYRDDSDVSGFGRGALTLAQCARELAEVIAECAAIRELSDGYFTDWPGGRFDPSGLVKGWAIERAAIMLSAAGFTGHCVNGAGDMQCTGEPEPGQPWRVGIAHPLHPSALAAVVTGRDIAVATSGTAERGAHIVNPRTGRPATELASVTVTGPRVATADAYATAAFAMGPAAREWVESLEGYNALAVASDGATWQTGGLGAYTTAG